MRGLLPQRCPIAFIYLSWLVYLGGVVGLAIGRLVPVIPIWLVGVPLLMWGYLRFFPSLSRSLGYGSVADRPGVAAPPPHRTAAMHVTLYTALGCPFCPIVRRRLHSLKTLLAFELEEVDVTLRPELLLRKGIRSVPVVEVEGRRLTGNATSAKLADLIAPPALPAARRPVAKPIHSATCSRPGA
ncbi:MAG TPA: glutaredoxin family protein [Candidatus Limnocylindrales bacterium]|nr:glutaredoxin family protein [Candidatus Limnocylindrales bacterium]